MKCDVLQQASSSLMAPGVLTYIRIEARIKWGQEMERQYKSSLEVV